MTWRNIHSSLTFSSWTQRARRRRSCTTARPADRSGSGLGGGLISSPTWERHSQRLYTLHLQEGEGCWRGPCLHCVINNKKEKKEKSQVHLARASNVYFGGLMHKRKVFSVTICACGFSIGSVSSAWEKKHFSYACSVPVSQLKCKSCRGHHQLREYPLTAFRWRQSQHERWTTWIHFFKRQTFCTWVA